MVCSKCNGEYAASAKFCPHCGATTEFVASEASDMNQNTYNYDGRNQQPPVATPGNNVQNNPYDVPSVLLGIISFFKPFIGLILYLSWQMEYPKRAKSVGLAALISVILRFFVLLITVLLCLTFFAPYIVEFIEEIMWYF